MFASSKVSCFSVACHFSTTCSMWKVIELVSAPPNPPPCHEMCVVCANKYPSINLGSMLAFEVPFYSFSSRRNEKGKHSQRLWSVGGKKEHFKARFAADIWLFIAKFDFPKDWKCFWTDKKYFCEIDLREGFWVWKRFLRKGNIFKGFWSLQHQSFKMINFYIEKRNLRTWARTKVK